MAAKGDGYTLTLDSSRWNIRRIAISLLLAISIPTIKETKAEEVKQDWLSAAFTPCEGFGVHGSAHFYLTATVSKQPDGSSNLTQVVIYGSSAAFDSDDTFLSATIAVVTDDSSGKTIKLVRPTKATIEQTPGGSETKRLYLPEGTSLRLAPGAKIKITVNAIKSDCSINSSTKVIDLGL